MEDKIEKKELEPLLDFRVDRKKYEKANSFIGRLGYPSKGEFHFLQENGEVSIYYTYPKHWIDNFYPLAIKIPLSEVESKDTEWVTFNDCFFRDYLEAVEEDNLHFKAYLQGIAISNNDSSWTTLTSSEIIKKKITIADTGNLTPVIKIKKGLLKEILLSLTFACSLDPRRGAMYGIQLEKKEDSLICASTDGSVVIEKRIPLSKIDLFDLDIFYLRKENIDSLLFFLEGNPEDLVEFFQSEKNVLQKYSFKRAGLLEREESHLRNEEKFLVIQMDNIQFISSYCLNSNFPDYKKLMDQERELMAIIPSFELEKALVKGNSSNSDVYLQGQEGDLLISNKESQKSITIKGREGSHTEKDSKVFLDKNNLIPFLFSLKQSENLKIFIPKDEKNSNQFITLEYQNSRFLLAQR